MPALFIFLLKVNIALLLFCAGYYLVLRPLTFYSLNRIYLVSAILFASVYPQINLSGFAQQHRQLSQPVQQIVLNWQLPAQAIIKPLTQPGYWHWIELIFWAGVLLLALRLMMQLYSLYKLYRNSTAAQIHNHNVRVINNDAGPFSFWKSIYVNPALHQSQDLKAILLHEQIHVNEWHTLDILLAELSTIFYWFNPGVWLMKKAIRENIEFITDRKILNKGIDSKQYQYSLVSVSFATQSNTIVNHFNISIIKKRIIMMNAKKSSKFKLTRYAFLVPAVMLLLVFTLSKAATTNNKSKNVLHHLPVTAKPLGRVTQTNQVPVVHLVTTKNKKQLIDTSKREIVNKNIYFPDSSTVQEYKADTSKKRAANVQTYNSDNDSRTYNVDGYTANKNDVKNLKRADIVTVNIAKTDGRDRVYIRTKSGTKSYPITVTRFGSGYTAYDTTKDGNGNTISVTKRRLNYDTSRFKQPLKVVQFGSTSKLNASNTYSHSSPNGNTFSIGLSSPYANTFSINSLSDKMIIIDGKTATKADLKKLSAFDIDRMVFKTDHETKELYGDKAKNGIVFILTKKNR